MSHRHRGFHHRPDLSNCKSVPEMRGLSIHGTATPPATPVSPLQRGVLGGSLACPSPARGSWKRSSSHPADGFDREPAMGHQPHRAALAVPKPRCEAGGEAEAGGKALCQRDLGPVSAQLPSLAGGTGKPPQKGQGCTLHGIHVGCHRLHREGIPAQAHEVSKWRGPGAGWELGTAP